MNYDFRSVLKQMDARGMTYRALGEHIDRDETTVAKAIKSGRAHPTTALLLFGAFGLPIKPVRRTSRARRKHQRRQAA